MEHTKGKLKLLPARNKHYLGGEIAVYERTIQRCFYLCGPKHDSHFVADLIVSTEREGLANAKHFVKCWNSHDALLATLEKIRQTGIDYYAGKIDETIYIALVKEITKEALTEAKISLDKPK